MKQPNRSQPKLPQDLIDQFDGENVALVLGELERGFLENLAADQRLSRTARKYFRRDAQRIFAEFRYLVKQIAAEKNLDRSQ